MNLIIVSAVNKPDVLAKNLLASDGVSEVCQMQGYDSAAKAYNAALKNLGETDAVAFIHQDVYLPAGWIERVRSQIEVIEQADPNWAVLGVWGRQSDGPFCGRVYCVATKRDYTGAVAPPTQARSFDEIVVIVNSIHGLRFDEGLPGFHLYGTDIVLEAERKGLRSYAIDAPVVHNSTFKANVYDRAYFRAHRYMRLKWKSQLPIRTCCAPITRTGIALYKLWLKRELRRLLRKNQSSNVENDPKLIAQTIKYESVEHDTI